MSDVTVEQVADAMFAMVKECHGKRQLKPLDLNKAMIERFGEAATRRCARTPSSS
jgi:hypothetical protein